MWVARYLFVGAVHFAVLAFIAAWAMGETIERAEIKLMPMQVVPVERAGQWTPPAERLADIIDELKERHGKELTWALLMREAARVKHEG
jgi:hypothetical protein